MFEKPRWRSKVVIKQEFPIIGLQRIPAMMAGNVLSLSCWYAAVWIVNNWGRRKEYSLIITIMITGGEAVLFMEITLQ